MGVTRPTRTGMLALVLTAWASGSVWAQMSPPPGALVQPPGPAVPILTEPTTPKPAPTPAAPPTGTLKRPSAPAVALAPPPPAPPSAPLSVIGGPAIAAPTPPPGTGALPVSNTPSNISPGNMTSTIAPPLPEPPLDENAAPAAFLRAARAALVVGKTGEAQEALERAESRALDRAVRPSLANTPSSQSLVKQIAAARQSLPSGDRARTLDLIEQALGNREALVR